MRLVVFSCALLAGCYPQTDIVLPEMEGAQTVVFHRTQNADPLNPGEVGETYVWSADEIVPYVFTGSHDFEIYIAGYEEPVEELVVEPGWQHDTGESLGMGEIAYYLSDPDDANWQGIDFPERISMLPIRRPEATPNFSLSNRTSFQSELAWWGRGSGLLVGTGTTGMPHILSSIDCSTTPISAPQRTFFDGCSNGSTIYLIDDTGVLWASRNGGGFSEVEDLGMLSRATLACDQDRLYIGTDDGLHLYENGRLDSLGPGYSGDLLPVPGGVLVYGESVFCRVIDLMGSTTNVENLTFVAAAPSQTFIALLGGDGLWRYADEYPPFDRIAQPQLEGSILSAVGEIGSSILAASGDDIYTYRNGSLEWAANVTDGSQHTVVEILSNDTSAVVLYRHYLTGYGGCAILRQ